MSELPGAAPGERHAAPLRTPSGAAKGSGAPRGLGGAVVAFADWIAARRYAAVVVFALLTLLTFPTLERLVAGRNAPEFALDVFDDGSFTHLGALVIDWRAHGVSWWNPHLTAGEPVMGQFMATPIAVDSALDFIVGPYYAYAVTYFLLILVAGIGTYLFLLQSVRLTPAASLAGGVFALFGFWHYALSFAPPLLPLILWLGDRALIDEALHPWLLLGWIGAAALDVYSHSMIALLGAAVQLAYAVYCAPGAAARRRTIAVFTGVWTLAVALYSPVLLTQLTLLPESQRALWARGAGNPFTLATLRDFLSLYSSTLLGVRVAPGIGGPPNWYATFFAGVVGLPLLALSMVVPRTDRRTRFVLLLLFALPLTDLLASTVILKAQDHLGILRSFQFVRVRHYLPFALAANIAVGVAYLESGRAAPRAERLVRSRWAWGALGALVVIQGATCARVLLYQCRSGAMARAGSGDFRGTMSVAGWSLGLLYFALGALFWLWAWRRHGAHGDLPDRGARLAGVLLAALAAQGILFARVERYIDASRLSTYSASLGDTPGLAYLESLSNPDAYRTVTIADRSRVNRVDHPNRMMYHGLYAADGYENIYPRRYHALFGLMTAPYLRAHPDQRAYFDQWGSRAYVFGPTMNRTLSDLMGIRWLYAHGVALHEPGTTLVFQHGAERIYESDSVFPRAFVTNGARVFADETALLAALDTASRSDLLSRAYVLASDVASQSLPRGAGSAAAQIVMYSPDEVRVSVHDSTPGILVLTDAYLPGWRADVNGRPAGIFPAFEAFRGVRVPAGASIVRFRYVPVPTLAGFALAGLALAAAVGWAALAARSRRAG